MTEAPARNTTGGWRWHLRALLRQRAWRDTTGHIAQWLDGTRPAHKHLLLIGGSAGWMMSGRWLQRFSRIDLIDIDPWAAQLFRLRHGRALRASGTQLHGTVADGLANLDALLQQYPQATLFFDNVLGQHVYRVGNIERAEADLARLTAQLQGRDWGSVHDLFSGPVDPRSVPAAPTLCFNAVRTPQGLQAAGLTDAALQWHLLKQVGGQPDWMDHLTSELFAVGSQSLLLAWPFLPTHAHWLQAGWSHNR